MWKTLALLADMLVVVVVLIRVDGLVVDVLLFTYLRP
jgi:hypothetical protein